MVPSFISTKFNSAAQETWMLKQNLKKNMLRFSKDSLKTLKPGHQTKTSEINKNL